MCTGTLIFHSLAHGHVDNDETAYYVIFEKNIQGNQPNIFIHFRDSRVMKKKLVVSHKSRNFSFFFEQSAAGPRQNIIPKLEIQLANFASPRNPPKKERKKEKAARIKANERKKKTSACTQKKSCSVGFNGRDTSTRMNTSRHVRLLLSLGTFTLRIKTTILYSYKRKPTCDRFLPSCLPRSFHLPS